MRKNVSRFIFHNVPCAKVRELSLKRLQGDHPHILLYKFKFITLLWTVANELAIVNHDCSQLVERLINIELACYLVRQYVQFFQLDKI